MNYSVVIVAAGSGSRMGLGYNKMLYQFPNGKTILETTVDIFANDDRCAQIIIVGSEQDQQQYHKLLQPYQHQFVLGGDTRQASVYHGLQVVNQPYVFIHDGARPWVSKDCLDRLVASLHEHDACLLMVPVKDTIKQVIDGKVVQTFDRSTLWQAQTPQAFSSSLILNCHEIAAKQQIQATDDAQLVELCSDANVYVVEGSYENQKVTTIEDLK